jgi:hypothetical protein
MTFWEWSDKHVIISTLGYLGLLVLTAFLLIVIEEALVLSARIRAMKCAFDAAVAEKRVDDAKRAVAEEAVAKTVAAAEEELFLRRINGVDKCPKS